MSCMKELVYLNDLCHEKDTWTPIHRYIIGLYCSDCGSFAPMGIQVNEPDARLVTLADIQRQSLLDITPCDEEAKRKAGKTTGHDTYLTELEARLDPSLIGKARYDALKEAVRKYHEERDGNTEVMPEVPQGN